MSDLYGVIGSRTYTNLLADPQGADVIAIDLKPGNGAISRGTLMYRESNGLYSPAASGQVSTDYQLVVLNEDVDTGSSIAERAVAEAAAAYRAGRFIDGAVKLASGGTLTAAHKVVLNLMGIVFNVKEGTDAYDNGSYTITYVANNNASPAEEDVTDVKLAGADYTILNNSASALGFTPPATKSFSKWNTKADGTGTDYSAAATYSTDADLKLYAVWA